MWERRSVLATGAALSVGTGLTSVGVAEADIDELPDGDAEHTPEESEDEDRVVAYDLATGEEQWCYVFDEREWTAGNNPSTGVEIDENTIYVSRGGELLALRSETEAPDDPEDDDPRDDEQDESDEQDEDQQGGEDDSDTREDDSDDGGSGSDNGGSSDDDGESVDDDDGDVGNGNAENGDTGNETDTENNSDADNVPGFTAGSGLLGGALGLEWLRRKAGVDESTSVNEPSE